MNLGALDNQAPLKDATEFQNFKPDPGNSASFSVPGPLPRFDHKFQIHDPKHTAFRTESPSPPVEVAATTPEAPWPSSGGLFGLLLIIAMILRFRGHKDSAEAPVPICRGRMEFKGCTLGATFEKWRDAHYPGHKYWHRININLREDEGIFEVVHPSQQTKGHPMTELKMDYSFVFQLDNSGEVNRSRLWRVAARFPRDEFASIKSRLVQTLGKPSYASRLEAFWVSTDGQKATLTSDGRFTLNQVL